MNYIKPYLGDKQISLVTTTDVQKMYNKLKMSDRIKCHPTLGHSLSDSMVRSIHMVLHEAMYAAVRERIIIKNPTEGTTLPRASRKLMKTLNNEQLERFLETIRLEPVWYDIFYVELTTGLRRGELCGLKWQDFDSELGKMKVVRTLGRDENGSFVEGETKTESGTRTIILPESTVELLRNRKETAMSEWVFPNFKNPNKPINPAMVYNRFQGLLKTASLPQMRMHDLRHTFATHAIASGVDPKTLSSILGHKRASFTLDTYAHVTDDMQRHAAEVVGGFITDIMEV